MSHQITKLNRIDQGDSLRLVFNKDPFPYTRLLANSRWTAGPNSQEAKYIAWKETIRDDFHLLDYQQQSLTGIPFHEPLALSGRFDVVDNYEGRDLDNIIKGIVDCLNPSRRKDWKDLKTFAWVDDRQIVSHQGFTKNPSNWVGPRIELDITSLWGRTDPNINFVQGKLYQRTTHIWAIEVSLGLTSPYTFLVDLVASPEEIKELQNSEHPEVLYLWPYSHSGVLTAFVHSECVLLYREFHRTKGISTDVAKQAINSLEWPEIQNILQGGKSKAVSRVISALGRIKLTLPSPSTSLSLLKADFDPTKFETTAAEFSQMYGSPWGSVRDRLRNEPIHWNNPNDPDLLNLKTQLGLEHDARVSAKSKAKSTKLPKPSRVKSKK